MKVIGWNCVERFFCLYSVLNRNDSEDEGELDGFPNDATDGRDRTLGTRDDGVEAEEDAGLDNDIEGDQEPEDAEDLADKEEE